MAAASETPPELLRAVQPRRAMSELAEEYKYNASLQERIAVLSTTFNGWRRVRGDGNCYWRALLVALLEGAASKPAASGARAELLGRVVKMAEAAATADRASDDARRAAAHVIHWCETTAPHMDASRLEAELCSTEAPPIDLDLILTFRTATAAYLRRNQDKAPGAPLEETGTAEAGAGAATGDSDFTYAVIAMVEGFDSFDGFLKDRVETMGEDAQGIVQIAAPLVLRSRVSVVHLDRREGVDLVTHDFPTVEGDTELKDAYLLFKPGHYDILYPSAAEDGSAQVPFVSAAAPKASASEATPGAAAKAETDER